MKTNFRTRPITRTGLAFGVMCWIAIPSTAVAQADGPALGTQRFSQIQITSGTASLDQIRAAGLKIFATPFNRLDGYGDGWVNPADTTSPGGRPTLQNNGTFLRVNGLDSQSCMECHSGGSFATVPFTFGVGGSGSANNNAMAGARTIDVDDEAGSGYASFDGRFINPPFLFGSGAVELLGIEMTEDLQDLRELAEQLPDVDVPLMTHGVSFGTLRYDSTLGRLDVSQVEGVDPDLVVRPFGRKGEFSTVRAFDTAAMQFHFGMQPVEAVGSNVDADQDGVVNELTIGEMSALHVFNTNLESPELRDWNREARAGANHFVSIGCVECHKPTLVTRSRFLPYRFPEVETEPRRNQYLRVDLSNSAANVPRNHGGLEIYLLSDLKRHDMGPGLAESTGSGLDSMYVTARLWGVADSAPYLHDGRATTLSDAILMHGGEAQASRDAFEALGPPKRVELLTFLKRHRTPRQPAQDLLGH